MVNPYSINLIYAHAGVKKIISRASLKAQAIDKLIACYYRKKIPHETSETQLGFSDNQ